jgi:hypothetical protein
MNARALIFPHMTLAGLSTWLPADVGKPFIKNMADRELILNSIPYQGYDGDRLYSFADATHGTIARRLSRAGTPIKLASMIGMIMAKSRLLHRAQEGNLGTERDMCVAVYAPISEKKKGNRETFSKKLSVNFVAIDQLPKVLDVGASECRVLFVDKIIEELYARYSDALRDGRLTEARG